MPPIDLKTLAVTPQPESTRIEVTDLVASPFQAPRAYQTAAPPDAYASRFEPVGSGEDLDRILKLPRRAPPIPGSARAEAMIDMMTARWSLGERACRCAELDAQVRVGKRQCLKRLNLIQAWTLYEICTIGGVLGSLPVGSGKGLLNLLAALALQEFDPAIQHALLLVPSNLVQQLEHEYLLLSEHFRVPEMRVHNGSNHNYTRAGEPVLHVRPYELLSGPKYSNWVRNMRPHAIISDECDRLSCIAGAGASRIMRYMYENGATRFCGWTGSLTDQSLTEYFHLAVMALQYGSPLPLDKVTTEEWGRALDASDSPAPPGALLALCEAGEEVFDGFRRRLTETPGFVISTASSVAVELIIEEKPAPPLPAIIEEALGRLRKDWVRPDTMVGSEYDEELVDAMQVAKCAGELACGLFYRFKYPRHEPEALIKEWLASRKDYHREVRSKLIDRREHLDSPMLCGHAAQRFWGDRPNKDDLPEWQCYSWPRWRAVKALVKPETEGVRVDDFLARDVTEWALANKGIVWYGMVEFGLWVSELSGLTMHTGGPKAAQRIAAETGERSILCSIKSHGRGRDGLQRLYNDQLFANFPSSAKMAEQVLGRLHRQGQGAELVTALLYRHTEETKATVDQALRRAKYVERTLGAEQKLRIGFRLE